MLGIIVINVINVTCNNELITFFLCLSFSSCSPLKYKAQIVLYCNFFSTSELLLLKQSRWVVAWNNCILIPTHIPALCSSTWCALCKWLIAFAAPALVPHGRSRGAGLGEGVPWCCALLSWPKAVLKWPLCSHQCQQFPNWNPAHTGSHYQGKASRPLGSASFWVVCNL